MDLKKMNFKGYMNKKVMSIIVYSCILLGAGFYLGTQNYSTKVTQTEQNRSQEDIRIVEKIIIKKDGEKIIYRTRTEKRDQTSKKRLQIIKKDHTWIGGLAYGIDQKYTISLDRKIFTNLYGGVYATSGGDFGVGLKITF